MMTTIEHVALAMAFYAGAGLQACWQWIVDCWMGLSSLMD